MRACEKRLQKLLKKLGVETLDLPVIKEKLARCTSPSQRQSMLKAVKHIAKVSGLLENQQRELREIADSQRQLARQTTVDVARHVFAGVELRIGEQTELLRRDVAKVSFRLVDEDDDLKILAERLTKPLRFS